jgi:DNA-binding PadR family transcriptional regulator
MTDVDNRHDTRIAVYWGRGDGTCLEDFASKLPRPVLRMYRHSVYIWCMTEVPMREPTFLILTALAAGAQHGYGIMADVGQISGGRVRLRAGTLYAALNRLAVEGLVEVDREEIVDARLRRYYRLTTTGTQRLAAEVDRMRRHATVAARRLALPGSPA